MQRSFMLVTSFVDYILVNVYYLIPYFIIKIYVFFISFSLILSIHFCLIHIPAYHVDKIEQ